MKNIALTSVLSLALATTMPTGARADLKDVIIGVGVGALASEAIRREKAKKKQSKKTYRSTTKAPRQPASLNSQYTREEKRSIQATLNSLGYNVGTVDGSLGPRSRSAISQFQVARGEAGTGQLTRPQFVALMAASSNPGAAFVVDRRLSRDEVVLMQTGLQRLGFYTSRIDGSAGPGTRRAREGFLFSQGQNPNTITQVQSAVLAAQAAGLPVPPYLMQEAQLQFQQANARQAPVPFGAAPAPQQPQTFATGFGAPAPQQGQQVFGAQPQQPQGAALFGTPQPQQPVQQQPQGAGLFGTPAPQAAQPAPGTGQVVNPLFGPAPQQQQLQPQPQAPAGQQLFATQPAPAPEPQPQGQQLFGTQPAPAPQQGQQLFATQPAPAPQQGQQLFAPQQGQQQPQAPAQQGGSLDIYAGGTPAPQPAPAAPAAGTQLVATPAPATPAAPATTQVATETTAPGTQQPTVSMFASPEGGGTANPLRGVLNVVAPSAAPEE